MGSFLNVVIARVPNGESVVRPRSRCPKCGDMIPGWLNIPVLSWIMLRGRCRACKNPISVRYPVVELLTALLYLAIGRRFGLSLGTLAGFIMAGGLIAITFIDIDHWLIPDEIAIPGAIIGLLIRPFAFEAPWWEGLVGALAGAAALWLVRFVWMVCWKAYVGIRSAIGRARGTGPYVPEVDKSEGMGLGDLTLLAMIGGFLGPGGLLPTVLIASVAGTVVGVCLQLVQMVRGEPEEPVPAEGPAKAPEAPKAAEPKAPADDDDDEDDWVPPPTAVPFGPFLALGALAELLFNFRAQLIGEHVLRILQP